MNKLILMTEEDLQHTVKNAVIAALQEYEKQTPRKEFSLNQVAKMVHLSWSTVRNLVKEGKLKTTGTGRITESSLREFLSQQ